MRDESLVLSLVYFDGCIAVCSSSRVDTVGSCSTCSRVTDPTLRWIITPLHGVASAMLAPDRFLIPPSTPYRARPWSWRFLVTAHLWSWRVLVPLSIATPRSSAPRILHPWKCIRPPMLLSYVVSVMLWKEGDKASSDRSLHRRSISQQAR